MSSFHNGIAAVENERLWGYIDSTGKEIIPCKYEEAEDFKDGLAKVKLPTKYPKGNGSIFMDTSSVVIEKYKYIDIMDRDVIKPQYRFINSFSEGLALVSDNNNKDYIFKNGYIDKTGKLVIPMDFSKAYDFHEGVAFVKKDNKLGILKNPNTPAIPIKAANTERLWGDNRYKTSAAISKSGWTQSDTVILVSGENYPDALVGTSFAYLKNAPVLITTSNELDNNIKEEIARLKAKNVYILGSDAAISQNVDKDLKQQYNVIRIGGTGLYDTAVKVGDEISKIKKFDTAVISAVGDFPDPLAIAPFSARNTMPILFSDKDSLRPDTSKALKDWGIKNVVIVGGTGVVSEKVNNQLNSLGISVTRLAGADRYDTALEIVKHYAPSKGYNNISIATGESYPDALTGAVLSAKNNSPLVLVSKDRAKDSAVEYLNSNSIDKAYIFGGTGVVSDTVVGK